MTTMAAPAGFPIGYDYNDDPRFDPLGGIPRGPDGKKQPYAPYGTNPHGVPYGPSVPIEGGDNTYGPLGLPTTLPLGNPGGTPFFPPGGGTPFFPVGGPYETFSPPNDGPTSWNPILTPAGTTFADNPFMALSSRDRSPAPAPPEDGAPAIPRNPDDRHRSAVARAYRDYLGREMTDADYQHWAGNDNFEDAIRNSPEAQARGGGGAPSTSGVDGGDYYGYFMGLTNGRPPTPAELQRLSPELAKRGIKVLTNASGVSGKIQLPSGEVVDVIEAAGAGGKAWQWLTGGGGSAAPGGGAPPVYDERHGELLEPWEEEWSYDPFKAPVGDDVFKDPGYLFRAEQGRKALENSAAAQGLLRSGGTMKELLNYGQQLASNEYGNAYDRAVGEYTMGRGDAWQEFQDRYQRWRDQRDSTFDKLRWQTELGRGSI